MREQLLATEPRICIERARLITEAYEETEGLPAVLRRAMVLEKILSEMSIYILDDELIVGNHSSTLRAAPVFPEYDVEFLERELDEFASRSGDKFLINEESKEELRKTIIPYWKPRTVRRRALSLLPQETILAADLHEGTVQVLMGNWTLENGDGHLAADYPKLLKIGLRGIIREAESTIHELDLTDPQGPSKHVFLRSTIISLNAAIGFSKRFADLARRKSEAERNSQRREELRRIAEVCEWVPANPPRTFNEALQSLWLLQLIIQIETNGHSVSLGRFDQYMYPFYKNDLNQGRITREEALELIECFWIKLSSLTKLRSGLGAPGDAGYPMYQNLTVGGQTTTGEDATNELSYQCLEATADVRLFQPLLTARYHTGCPEEFLIACCNLIKAGLGFPAMFNDGIIIPSMLSRGVAIEDAFNYCLAGCVEPQVQGKWGGRAGACETNLVKILELTLNNGIDPRTGICLCAGDGDLTTFKSFEDLMKAYRKQVEYYVRHHIILDNATDIAWEELAPTPLLSALVSDCMRRGKDIKQGGAVYDYTGGDTGGVANLANSMAAIKKLIFEERSFTAVQLKRALDTNFEGLAGEKIRQTLIHRAPKFGNDDEYVDLIAKEAFSIFLREVSNYKNTRFGRGPIGCTWQPSTASTASNVAFGKVIGAMPDGRKAGEPVADTESPFRGTEMKGPTAVAKSVSKLDHIYLSGGSILNMKLSPQCLSGENGIRTFASLIRTYFDMNGMEVQFNVISRETLREAQKHPENYRDLIVRVAGYSALFVALDPSVQEDIIARTEYDL